MIDILVTLGGGGGGGFPGKKMSLGLSYGPIVSSLDNQAALRKRNMARQNNSSSVGRPTMAIRDKRGVRAKVVTVDTDGTFLMSCLYLCSVFTQPRTPNFESSLNAYCISCIA